LCSTLVRSASPKNQRFSGLTGIRPIKHKNNKKVSASSHFLLFPCSALLIANSHYIPLIRGMKAGNAKNSVASVCVSNYNKLGAVFIFVKEGKIMQEKEKGGFSFINEQIKEKPLNKKRLVKKALFTVALAVIFGAVAALVFSLLQPEFSNWFYPEEKSVVTIPKDDVTETEETGQDDTQESTEQKDTENNGQQGENKEPENGQQETEEAGNSQQEQTDEPETEHNTGDISNNEMQELELADFQKLQNKLYAVGKEANKFIVTVTGVKSDTDWFNNPYESKGQASGIIVAENGRELLVLTERKAIADAQEIYVTFINDAVVKAEMKKYDGNTGIAVLSVKTSELTESTKNAITVAVLGNSLTVTQGTIAIAIGSPLGTNYSILTGNITSTTNSISTIDHNYSVFTTDIVGSSNGSGALVNVDGEIIGIVMQGYSSAGDENTLTAISISELKALIEMLSNGQDIPYIGLEVTTVTAAIEREYEIPKGAYIKDVCMDSPAMAAGLQNGDVITEIDGDEILTAENYEKKLLSLKPEDTVEVKIERQGPEGYTEITCTVEVSVLP
jgi:trypsin-like serine proteases, typically periplasmic, contain C-terminal PDZ domain